MAYDLFIRDDKVFEIFCIPGQITHIRLESDGIWKVDEDHESRVFTNFREALDFAREIGGDPDLAPPKDNRSAGRELMPAEERKK